MARVLAGQGRRRRAGPHDGRGRLARPGRRHAARRRLHPARDRCRAAHAGRSRVRPRRWSAPGPQPLAVLGALGDGHAGGRVGTAHAGSARCPPPAAPGPSGCPGCCPTRPRRPGPPSASGVLPRRGTRVARRGARTSAGRVRHGPRLAGPRSPTSGSTTRATPRSPSACSGRDRGWSGTPRPRRRTRRGPPLAVDLLPPTGCSAPCRLAVAALVVALWRAAGWGPWSTEPLPVVVRAAEAVEGRARLYRRGRGAGGTAAAACAPRPATGWRRRWRCRGAAAGPRVVAAVAAADAPLRRRGVPRCCTVPAPADDAASCGSRSDARRASRRRCAARDRAASRPAPDARPLRRRSRCARGRQGRRRARTPPSPGWSSRCCAGATCCSRACPASPRRCWSARSRAALALDTKRVQFTPDLMPGDVTGSLVYDARTAEFPSGPGPVFTNLLLADEINRTPPKTQAVAAGGDGGAPGHRRRRAAPAARPVRRRRHAEPGRVRGHLPAARGPARPVPAQADPAAAGARRRDPGAAPARRRLRPARPRGGRGPAGGRRRPTSRPAGPRSPVTVGAEVLGYVVDVCRATRAVAVAAARASPRAARPRCWPRPGPGRGCPAATTSRPTTSRRWPARRCGTGCSCGPRPSSRASPPTRVLDGVLAPGPRPPLTADRGTRWR